MTNYPTVEELLFKLQNLTLENFHQKSRIDALEKERQVLIKCHIDAVRRESEALIDLEKLKLEISPKQNG